MQTLVKTSPILSDTDVDTLQMCACARKHAAPADFADWIRSRALRHQTPLPSGVL